MSQAGRGWTSLIHIYIYIYVYITQTASDKPKRPPEAEHRSWDPPWAEKTNAASRGLQTQKNRDGGEYEEGRDEAGEDVQGTSGLGSIADPELPLAPRLGFSVVGLRM